MHGALVVGQHLDLDMAGALDELLEVHTGITEGLERLRRRGFQSSRRARPASCTTRIPLPPPPAAALTITG